LYAAQLFAAAQQQLGPLDEPFRRGEFEPLRSWLRQHIHRQGQCYTAVELIERTSGQPLSHSHLLSYLRGKYGPLYGLA
jgi:carboxypeptidase Taq